MKHNSTTQSDTNMNFDGMENMKPASLKRFAGNKWSGHSNDGRLVQKPQAPNRRGNDGSCDTPGNLGASVTRDSNRKTMTSPMPSLPAQGSVRDNINRGSQYRGEGGVMAKSPSNPDKIRVGQSGGGTYNSEKPSKTPATQRGKNNFNFGPKSQY
jgi:hypothetical protein